MKPFTVEENNNIINSNELEIKLEFPIGWESTTQEVFDLLIYDASKEEYVSNIGFTNHLIKNISPVQFEELITQNHKVKKQTYNDFKEVKAMKYMHFDYPAYFLSYTWTDDKVNQSYFQMLVLIATPSRLIQADAATLLGWKDEYQHTFSAILQSILINNHNK